MLGLPQLTPADVVALAQGAPPVTAEQVQEALDWLEPLLERRALVIAPNSRQERSLKRAVSAYAVYLALSAQNTNAAQQQQVVKLKDGSEEITFADSLKQTLSLPDDWLARAWRYLREVGISSAGRTAGVSK